MYMVFFVGCGMSWPFGWDADCPGAIRVCPEKPVLFATRAEAKQAIAISTAYARLQESLGRPVDTDFTAEKRNIVIRKCEVSTTREDK